MLIFLQKIMYLLCFSPYRICIDLTGALYVKTWYFQKLICFMLTCLSSSYFLLETFQDLYRDKLFTLRTYFVGIIAVINLLQRLLITKFYWLDHNKLLTCLSKVNKIPTNQINIQAVNRFIIVIGSLTFGISMFQIHQFVDLQLKCLPNCLKDTTSGIFISIFVWIFKIIGRVHSNTSVCFGSIYFLSTTYLVWRVSISFKIFLKRTETNIKAAFDIWKDVETRFETLCLVCKGFNELYGHTVSCLVVEIVLYYAIEFEGSFPSGVRRIVASNNQMGFILYLVVTSAFLYFAADINRNVGYLKDWLVLKENRSLVFSSRDLNFIIDQLNCNAVSVKASNVFPVTFGFVASVS